MGLNGLNSLKIGYNGSSGSLQGAKYIDRLNKYQLLKKEPSAVSYLGK
jgi:hypothetical protein